MSLAALFSWLTTVSGGLYLLIIWLIEYDHEFQSGAATRLPVPVISTHALLAVTGLGLWGYYLFSDSDRLVWAAVAILAVVAVLGLLMAARWVVVYRTHRAPRARGPRGWPSSRPARIVPGPAFLTPPQRIVSGPAGTPAPRSPGRPNGISRCRSSSGTASSPSSRSCSSC